ncbi:MAG: fused MFS/spermidine synthase [Pirellulaceae bacterium]
MSNKMPLASVLPFALTILLGAFLVFQVQPVFSNSVLPWFGGTPAVWTTCMLFFQVVLFGGYLYAHVLSSRLQPKMQVIVHSILLLVALCTLPIEPDPAWKPAGGESPLLYLLCLLGINVGLPYFVLSSTGPLVQKWLSYRNPDDSVYRLFALSNIGSLAALLTYPFLFEPMLSLSNQSWFWSAGFAVYVVCQLVLLVGLWRVTKPESSEQSPDSDAQAPAEPSRGQLQAWLLLPAFASVMLLAVTNHVCQDVAVIPFLWVLPLSIYLLSFIISFDRPAWYRPKLFAAICLGMMLAWTAAEAINPRQWLPVEILYNMAILFLVCMLCHGEVARIKPHTRYLTKYFLYLSAGGAVGGLFVGLICPLVFNSFVEYSLGMFGTAVLAIIMLIAHRSWKDIDFNVDVVRRLRWAAVGVVLLATFMGANKHRRGLIATNRNFFGLVKVLEYQNGHGMVHGNTLHGSQFHKPNHRIATSYFGEPSGIARTLRFKGQQGPIHVCTCGLGVGTMATYGRSGDRYEFIEINPVVEDFARDYFSFLEDSEADVTVHIGDGRLVLERSQDKYDIVVMDSFSSDSVPAHLLTVEAMQLYANRIKPDGLIAVNVINRHLNISHQAHRLAHELGWHSREIRAEANPEHGMFQSQWVVISRDPQVFTDPIFADAITPSAELIEATPAWTDQYHNLFSLLKW